MNVVETCKCGGSVRAVGSPMQTSLMIASFRDAHATCREPKFEVVTLPSSAMKTEWTKIGEGPVYASVVKNDYDDLPCPKCGGDRLRPNFTGEGSRCHADSSALTSGRLDPNPDGEFLDGEQP